MNTDKIYAEKIAQEYAPKKAQKIVALKKLDEKAKRPANIFAFSFGTVFALILGIGMCLTMGVIGSGAKSAFVFGIIIGLIGIAGISANYPLYKKILENSKKKYAFDIVQLAKEISGEE